MSKILVITGPTATGKTALGIKLAKKFNGEIISADSQHVYQEQDEERGKDKDLYTQAEIKVWGLDILKKQSGYNVSGFVSLAHKAISDISAREKLPIVVGGSGQYIKELLYPSETLHLPPNMELRSKNYELWQLQDELQKVNSQRWEVMNPSDKNNPRRLIRAIEISLAKPKKGLNPFWEHIDGLVIGLTAPSEFLYQKIVARRKDRPDLVKKESTLAKKQFLYQKKHLPARWFDITRPTHQDEIVKLVQTWYGQPQSQNRD